MTEWAGFEPACPGGQLDFESSALRPLRYHSWQASGFPDTFLIILAVFPSVNGFLSGIPQHVSGAGQQTQQKPLLTSGTGILYAISCSDRETTRIDRNSAGLGFVFIG